MDDEDDDNIWEGRNKGVLYLSCTVVQSGTACWCHLHSSSHCATAGTKWEQPNVLTMHLWYRNKRGNACMSRWET